MRCLYCGKELALLKRWTGGGEFCSDVHRQRYQEEYNQLALNRLLQAKPPSDPQVKPAVAAEPPVSAEPVAEVPVEKTVPAKMVEAKSSERTPAKLTYRESPSPAALMVETPVVSRSPAPPVLREPLQQTVVEEEPAPAEMAGFLVEIPVPTLEAPAPVSLDLEFLQAATAAIPEHKFEPSDARSGAFELETGEPLTFLPSNRAVQNTASASRERGLEVRDFVRTIPIMDIVLNPAGETGLKTSSEAMDITFFPQPPEASAALWQEPPVEFSTSGTALGDLARLYFATTGFSHQEDSNPEEYSSPLVVEAPAIEVHAEVEEQAAEVVTELLPELLPEPSVEVAPVPEVAVQGPPAPEPVTTPLPLILQVAAPGKAKAVQVFSSASSSIAVEVPRSTSLPLRPTITFGPAPAKAAGNATAVAKSDAKSEPMGATKTEIKAETKPEAKKPVTPAPARPANGKVRQPEVKTEAKIPKPEIAQPVAKPAANPVNIDKKPETKQPERSLPAPLAAPFPGSGDLGLPRLNMESPGFWGGLPMVAKIVIVVILLAGLGGLIAYSAKSGDAAVTNSQGGKPGDLITGSLLPAGVEGWIKDWGSESGAHHTRQISILRASQTYTDYRIQMQGQIETKAIGWVFRAADPKNFYVAKIEIVKPGLEPTVALVRFAVINGEEQAHSRTPLPMKVWRDTMYKIRFDAVGNHFTTYIQDQKVAAWTDDRISTGGVGLYSERGEVATLKGSGMDVLSLTVKK